MPIVSKILETLRITNCGVSAAKKAAAEIWQNNMYWGSGPLKKAVEEGRIGSKVFEVVAAGGLTLGLNDAKQLTLGLNDAKHLSLFRAFEHHQIADHFVELLEQDIQLGTVSLRESVYQRWGHIEHKAFWSTAARHLNQDDWLDCWAHVLDEAASSGNIVPFEVCLPSVLRDFFSIKSGRMVHPTVAKWLVNTGLWSQAYVELEVNPATCPIVGTRFMGMQQRLACESGYVVDMCEDVMRDYALSNEQKVRFVGQAMLSLGAEYWTHALERRLAPYLDGIELGVLKAVCAVAVLSSNAEEQQLYDTLRQATQVTMLPFNPKCAHLLMREGQHPGLLLIMDLEPPQDRVALYQLGAMIAKLRYASTHELGTLDLPNFN